MTRRSASALLFLNLLLLMDYDIEKQKEKKPLKRGSKKSKETEERVRKGDQIVGNCWLISSIII